MKNSPIPIYLIVAVMLAMYSAGCNCNDCEPFGTYHSISKNIIPLPWSDSVGRTGNYNVGIWVNNEIFYSAPFRKITLDNSFKILSDTTIPMERSPWLWLYPNKAGSSALFTVSRRFNGGEQYRYKFIGALLETDLRTHKETLILDSNENVSSAVYTADPNEVIYYSYGKSYSDTNQHPDDAGYYRYNRVSREKILLFPSISIVGIDEGINGFDIYPYGSKLVIPMMRGSNSPRVGQLDLATGRFDTLDVRFDSTGLRNRISLCLRFNHAGTELAYSLFDELALSGATYSDASQAGLIQFPSLQKRTLDLNTSTAGSTSIFPNWSPDDNHILFASKSWGALDFRMFIYKSVH